MLLFREAPKKDVAHRGAIYCESDVVFSRSFYGITTSSNRRAEADYLYVLSYADLLAYWTLMTSSKFGVERDIYNLDDFLSFPVVPLGDLTASQSKSISQLAADLKTGRTAWSRLNSLVADVYAMSTYDRDLVADALQFENPYQSSKLHALTSFGKDDPRVQEFVESLATIVSDVEGIGVSGVPFCLDDASDHVWQFVRLTVGEQRLLDRGEIRTLLQQVPDTLMSSEIRLQLSQRDWLIGRLRQGRYWSRSQARLLALDIIDQGSFGSPDH